jgi:hypothetical protein
MRLQAIDKSMDVNVKEDDGTVGVVPKRFEQTVKFGNLLKMGAVSGSMWRTEADATRKLQVIGDEPVAG